LPKIINNKKTLPPVRTTAISKRQPSTYHQLGYATSYVSNGDVFLRQHKPNNYELAAWDNARRNEPILKQGLEYIVNAVIARTKNYSHPNSQINDFVQENIEGKLHKWGRELLESIIWSGFGADEILWEQKIGFDGMPQTWINDLVNFHPMHIYLVPNNYGVIEDGATVFGCPYKSGVWVPLPSNHLQLLPTTADKVGNLVRLSKSKRVYSCYKGENNSLYGRPLVDNAVVKWHLFKNVFTEMLTTALGRYGTPLVYVKVPPHDSKESITEPDGTLRLKTMQELTVEQLQNLDNDTALVFTQLSKDQPVEIGALTTGNNFANSFTEAIELCDDNMRTSLSIPNLITKHKIGGLGSGGAAETQLQMFNLFIEGVADYVIDPLVNQVIMQLISYNFDPRLVKDAHKPGSIKLKPARYTDLKVILDGLKALALEHGLIQTDADRNYVKELLGFPNP
jgi:hypothetical protein